MSRISPCSTMWRETCWKLGGSSLFPRWRAARTLLIFSMCSNTLNSETIVGYADRGSRECQFVPCPTVLRATMTRSPSPRDNTSMLISALMLFQNMCISQRTRVIMMPDHRIQPKLHKTRAAHEFLEIAIKGALPFSFDGLLMRTAHKHAQEAHGIYACRMLQ